MNTRAVLIISMVKVSVFLSFQAFAATDAWYLSQGACPSSATVIAATQLNAKDATETCLGPLQSSLRADPATKDAVQHIGETSATTVLRVVGGVKTPAVISEVYETIAGPIVPLQVDRLQYYQATVASCDPKASFSFRAVNDSGLFGLKVQRGRGERDIRVNTIDELPTEWSLERVRYEILYERAVFRGLVERPTFDILRPDAERPLLVTVFDVLPRVRSQDSCPTLHPGS
jgi:hypothetical protein